MEESIEKWLNRIDISNPSWTWQSALYRLAKKYESEWKKVQCEIWGDFPNTYAFLNMNNEWENFINLKN